jgi:hypothetical protein
MKRRFESRDDLLEVWGPSVRDGPVLGQDRPEHRGGCDEKHAVKKRKKAPFLPLETDEEGAVAVERWRRLS